MVMKPKYMAQKATMRCLYAIRENENENTVYEVISFQNSIEFLSPFRQLNSCGRFGVLEKLHICIANWLHYY